MRTLHPVLVAICFLFVACAPQSGMEELRTELGAVSARLNAAEKKIAEFEVFKRAQQMQNGLRDANKVAFLTPADSGYATVATDIGTLTVSLENVQAYANGSKIALRWGNPMSASVRGLEATVEWGTVDASGNFDDDNAKSKDISFAETFRSGTWTNTQVVLDGVPPTSLGFVRIRSVNNKAISLMR